MFGIVLASLIATYPIDVADCYDADTCTVTIHSTVAVQIIDTTVGVTVTIGPTKVRLCDIDAPERRGETLTIAKFSRSKLLEWIRAATRVELELPKGDVRDKYGRLLGWIIADGVNLNQRLVDEGLAQEYRIKCER